MCFYFLLKEDKVHSVFCFHLHISLNINPSALEMVPVPGKNIYISCAGVPGGRELCYVMAMPYHHAIILSEFIACYKCDLLYEILQYNNFTQSLFPEC